MAVTKTCYVPERNFPSSKNKTTLLQKNVLYFQEIKLFNPRLKNVLYFSILGGNSKAQK